jgi:hypothetical protein
MVKLPSGPTSFQSTVVKPYLQPPKSNLEIDLEPQEPKINLEPQGSKVNRTAQPPIESQLQPPIES